MRFINVLLMVFLVSQSQAGDVQKICDKTGVNTLTLYYQKRSENINVIRNADLGKSKLAVYLNQLYETSVPDDKELAKIARLENEKYLPESAFKKTFLKYSNTESKLVDPKGYRSALLSAIDSLVPKEMNFGPWFLNLRDPQILSTAIRPAVEGETSSMYGALARIEPQEKGKYKIEIVFSNNDSEPLPYLIPLVVHEFQHVISFKEKVAISDGKKKLEYLIVEEAKGFDMQMKAYIALASKNPELFCNWLYPTWAYGDLLVPLSWTMNSMENEMKSGQYILRYAQSGIYKGQTFLLNSKKTALRADIQARINALKLTYVR